MVSEAVGGQILTDMYSTARMRVYESLTCGGVSFISRLNADLVLRSSSVLWRAFDHMTNFEAKLDGCGRHRIISGLGRVLVSYELGNQPDLVV